MISPRELLDAIRRPAAIRVLVGYAGLGWLLVAVAEGTTHYLGAPDVVGTAVTVAVLIGAPAVLYRLVRGGTGADGPSAADGRPGVRSERRPLTEAADAEGVEAPAGRRAPPSLARLVLPLLISLTLAALALAAAWWAVTDGSGLR